MIDICIHYVKIKKNKDMAAHTNTKGEKKLLKKIKNNPKLLGIYQSVKNTFVTDYLKQLEGK